jgi:hypothetical protein
MILQLINTILIGWLLGKASFFTIILLNKWGTLNWYDMHKKRWMPRRCEFCLGFWLCVIEACIFFTVLFSHDFTYLYVLSPIIGSVICYQSSKL